jgi:sodium-dependent phosphate cotransporter
MPLLAAVVRRVAYLLIGIWLILASLEALKRGVSAVSFLFSAVVSDWPSALGLGWLSACALLSGSPAAALALTFMGEGRLDRFEGLAMITGSRLGSCFVVLAVGLLHDLRSKRQGRTSYIGIAGLFVTATLCVPALAIGLHLLGSETLVASLAVSSQGAALDLLDPLLVPVRALLDLLTYPLLAFVTGIALLLSAFKVFDLALPDLSSGSERLDRLAAALFRPSVMFLLGAVVTLLTLSVSVSLTVLVPLTARGYIRRENLFPYMMGANVTTFVDTLLVSLLVPARDAFPTVVVLVISVTAIAVPIVLLAEAPYARLIDRMSRAVARSPRREMMFVAGLFVVPLLLIAGSKVFSS